MTNARCISTCYDSGASALYEADKTYEVDEAREWIQLHFDVPQTVKKAKAKGREGAPSEVDATGEPDNGSTEPEAPAGGKKGGKKGGKAPGSLE